MPRCGRPTCDCACEQPGRAVPNLCSEIDCFASHIVRAQIVDGVAQDWGAVANGPPPPPRYGLSEIQMAMRAQFLAEHRRTI